MKVKAKRQKVDVESDQIETSETGRDRQELEGQS